MVTKKKAESVGLRMTRQQAKELADGLKKAAESSDPRFDLGIQINAWRHPALKDNKKGKKRITITSPSPGKDDKAAYNGTYYCEQVYPVEKSRHLG